MAIAAPTLDVAIVGAGPAGIAAGRALVGSGLSFALFEARPRLGGRAHTVEFGGHPVDLGAHWLHAGPVNPLVALARAQGEPIRRAAQARHLYVGSRRATAHQEADLGRAFTLADRALSDPAHRAHPGRPAAQALPPLGRFGAQVACIEGLVSGRPLGEIEAGDHASLRYEDNWFIAGGYGAYVARLARGLPVRLATPVGAIDRREGHVVLETAAGPVQARAAILAVPVLLLARGALRTMPAWPAPVAAALAAFRPGLYEHVLLRWPSAPMRGADRLTTFADGRPASAGMLSRLDGTALHYLELDAPMAEAVAGRPHAAARLARAVLAGRFGHRAIADLRVLMATDWASDPWSAGSWATLAPGGLGARQVLRAPVEDRVLFAGEHLSRTQWGTVGGAWLSGEKAARAVVELLGAQRR